MSRLRLSQLTKTMSRRCCISSSLYLQSHRGKGTGKEVIKVNIERKGSQRIKESKRWLKNLTPKRLLALRRFSWVMFTLRKPWFFSLPRPRVTIPDPKPLPQKEGLFLFEDLWITPNVGSRDVLGIEDYRKKSCMPIQYIENISHLFLMRQKWWIIAVMFFLENDAFISHWLRRECRQGCTAMGPSAPF